MPLPRSAFCHRSKPLQWVSQPSPRPHLTKRNKKGDGGGVGWCNSDKGNLKKWQWATVGLAATTSSTITTATTFIPDEDAKHKHDARSHTHRVVKSRSSLKGQAACDIFKRFHTKEKQRETSMLLKKPVTAVRVEQTY